MAFSTGVASQLGFGKETTWGTQVAPDHFVEFDGNPIPDLTQNWARGAGIYSGGQFVRLSRMVQTTRAGAGVIDLDVTTKNLGLLLGQALGSSVTAPTLVTGSAYKQVHQNGSQDGRSLTVQVGIPEVGTGTVKPMTGVGGKCADFELSCKEDELLKLAMNMSYKDVLTLATTPAANALAAASYVTPAEVFNWSQAVVKIGGTATTTSGVVGITGGTQVAAITKGFALKVTNAMSLDGYGTSAVMAREQKSGRTTGTLTLDLEYGTQAEFYDIYRAGTVVPVQITFTGSLIAGSDFNQVDIVIAGTKIPDANPSLNADMVSTQSVTLEVGNDSVNKEIQVTYKNTDATI